MAKTEKVKLTDPRITKIESKEKEYTVWDAGLDKLGLRVRSTGSKAFIYKYRFNGQQRKFNIGPAHIGIEQARKVGLHVASQISEGIDPAGQRRKIRTSPSVEEAFRDYLKESVEPKTKPRTFGEYKRILERVLPDKFKRLKAASVNRDDCVDLFQQLSAKPIMANRTISVLHAFFNWCEGDGKIRKQHTNPCHQIKKNKETRRKFKFKNDELRKLGIEIKKAESEQWPFAVYCILLILVTGLRKNEALQLQWSEVHLDEKRIFKEDSKTGSKEISLNDQAIALLTRLQEMRQFFRGGDYVFISPKDHTKPFVGLPKIWDKIRKGAGMPELRLHDLRHNVGSTAAMMTQNPVLVKAILSHAQLSTTDLYMNPSLEDQSGPDNEVGKQIENSLNLDTLRGQ